MSIRILCSVVFLIFFISSYGQDACSRVNLDQWSTILGGRGVEIGKATPVQKKRESLCRIKTSNSSLVLKLSIIENDVFDKFPNLFRTTIDKYISNGEVISKLKPNRPKRQYSKLVGIKEYGAIHVSNNLVKCYWIIDGNELFTLELTDENYSEEDAFKLVSELISNIK